MSSLNRQWRYGFTASLFVLLPVIGLSAIQLGDDCEDEAIAYSKSIPTDPISRLQKKIDSGEIKLAHNDRNGYLPAVLKALGIPLSSQTLVFSKTSFQRDLISPRTPRAVYFNDHTYIGWCQGGPVVEVATVDPKLGGVFYVLSQEETEKPKFIRQTHECLQCHDSPLTGRVPGHMMRSVYSDAAGQPIFTAGTYLSTDQSPLTEKFGGWYVTGQHGGMRHLGNTMFTPAQTNGTLDLERGANVTDLTPKVDLKPYLTKHSDIVALLVNAHQTHLHNLITRAGYGSRMALHYEARLNKELSRPDGYRSESTTSRIRSSCEPLVKALLFSGESTLGGRIQGTSGYASEFVTQGPRDTKGRSLRELDLTKRLFKYPCSYLVYSEAFQALPAQAKQYIYNRLDLILSGREAQPEFAHLTETDRKTVREILTETIPEFAQAVASH